jgi:hypothetical protein
MREKLRRATELPRCVNSTTDRENTDPNLAMPSKETEAPSRAKLRIASEDPRWRKSKTEIDEPILAKLRNAIEDDMCEKSSTAREEPKRAIPTSDKADPKRPKDRRDSVDPI